MLVVLLGQVMKVVGGLGVRSCSVWMEVLFRCLPCRIRVAGLALLLAPSVSALVA